MSRSLKAASLNVLKREGSNERGEASEMYSEEEFLASPLSECGIGWSNSIIWLASHVLRPFLVNTTVWANVSKLVAIFGTALISYLGMRLWVFVSKLEKEGVRPAG
jgi:hypothetical protein